MILSVCVCGLASNIFSPLVRLEILALDNNCLMFIHPTALPPVKTLYLDNNNLSHIPPYVLNGDANDGICIRNVACSECEYNIFDNIDQNSRKFKIVIYLRTVQWETWAKKLTSSQLVFKTKKLE